MKKRTLSRYAGSGPCGPETGEHCPASGWWAPLNRETEATFITEGSIMPTDGGNPATWQRIDRPTRNGVTFAWPPRNDFLDALW